MAEPIAPKVSDLPARFADKIRVDLLTGCWLWVANRHRNGYGRVYWQGSTTSAHIVTYRLLVGPVPPGRELDHVRARGCSWRNCCNPAHLEPVTHAENMRRRAGVCCSAALTLLTFYDERTHCGNGHALTPDNLVSHGKRRPECARCNADRVTATYRRDMQDPAKAAVIRAKAAERMRRYRERHGDPTGKFAMRAYRARH